MKVTVKRFLALALASLTLASFSSCALLTGDETDEIDGTKKSQSLSDPASPDPEKAKTVICVDAGHGVGDVGAISPFTGDDGSPIYEKDINLEICQYLVDELRSLGYTVVMARGADEEEPAAGYDADGKCGIRQRVTWANAQGYDLYVSIHCNSFTDPEVSGTRLYYHKDNNGAENKALCNALSAALLRFSRASPKIVSDADLYAVTATQMPAVLIENGFITNKDDFANMTDSRWQQLFAKAVAEGIDEYLVQ
ncbi:MAG: N-acetylmuramoyl-L-alanine amidase [Eubacteriales bacterium]